MKKTQFGSVLTKHLAKFDVDSVTEIKWNVDAFDNLVMAETYKRLILSFVESQVANKDSFDDIIEGKGLLLVSSRYLELTCSF